MAVVQRFTVFLQAGKRTEPIPVTLSGRRNHPVGVRDETPWRVGHIDNRG